MIYEIPRGYLSPSSIGTYLRCGLQYKFRYIDEIISPPNINLLSGKACHTGNEVYYREIIEGSGERMKPSMVVEVAQAALEDAAAEEEYRLQGQEKDDSMKSLEQATTMYINEIGQYVEPVNVEQKIEYESRCGVPIIGYIDLVMKDDDKSVLVDYKYTGKKWSANDIKNSLQFTVYTLSTGIDAFEVQNLTKATNAKKLTKPKKDGDDFSYVVDIASNLRILRHRFGDADFVHVENQIEAVAQAITAGVFIPSDMGAWNCSEKWCGYWHLCRGATH